MMSLLDTSLGDGSQNKMNQNFDFNLIFSETLSMMMENHQQAVSHMVPRFEGEMKEKKLQN
jgi:tRNA A-37 threonylcarbamoyl transferase component Bud32